MIEDRVSVECDLCGEEPEHWQGINGYSLCHANRVERMMSWRYCCGDGPTCAELYACSGGNLDQLKAEIDECTS